MSTKKRTLFPYIGLTDDGQIRMFVSPSRLNQLGAMHKRGMPFPEIIHDVQDGDQTADATAALRMLEAYLARET